MKCVIHVKVNQAGKINVRCQVSRVTCQVSCVRCHVSGIMCQVSCQCQVSDLLKMLNFNFQFLTKWWGQSVEGLLSTGRTPSSLKAINPQFPSFNFSTKGRLTLHTVDSIDCQSLIEPRGQRVEKGTEQAMGQNLSKPIVQMLVFFVGLI